MQSNSAAQSSIPASLDMSIADLEASEQTLRQSLNVFFPNPDQAGLVWREINESLEGCDISIDEL
ncbi:MAG TPA: hypothetical protein V6C57_29640 [Coleofasciculaceae cyanobacterium]